jgi:hypothetical protein
MIAAATMYDVSTQENLIGAGGQAALDIRQSDVRNRRIEGLHDGCEYRADRDDHPADGARRMIAWADWHGAPSEKVAQRPPVSGVEIHGHTHA